MKMLSSNIVRYRHILLLIISIIFYTSSGCREINEETDEPIQLGDRIIGGEKLRVINPLQYVSHYSKLIEIKYSEGKKEYTIIKQWFKRSSLIRMELISPGLVPQTIIRNGKNTWTYFYFGREIYESNDTHIPNYYINRITMNGLISMKNNRNIIEQGNEYIFEDIEITKSGKSIMEGRLSKTTLLPTYWELRIYDHNGKIEYRKYAEEILYEISFPDTLFMNPRELRVIDYKNNIDVEANKRNANDLIMNMGNEGHENNIDLDTMAALEMEYQQLLKIDPNIPEAYCDLGNLAWRRKEYSEAELLYQKAIRHNNRYRQSYMALISLYINTNQKESAKKWIAKYLHDCPPSASLDYYLLGNYYESVGAYHESVSMYEKGLIAIKEDSIGMEEGKKEEYENKLNENYKKRIEELKRKMADMKY